MIYKYLHRLTIFDNDSLPYYMMLGKNYWSIFGLHISKNA